MPRRPLIVLLACLTAGAAAAQTPDVELGALECLANEFNASFTATVTPDVAGAKVQLHFRRLSPTGAWYFVEMFPTGDGEYWTVFPKPEDRRQTALFDEWWEILQDRDWMTDRDRDWLEDWLEDQEHEATEYRVVVADGLGSPIRESEVRLVQVLAPDLDPDFEERERFEARRNGTAPPESPTDRRIGDAEDDDCPVLLTRVELGWASNLTVGETTPNQVGHPVFHWMCDGIVTRLGSNSVFRADEYCRACVVGAWFPPVSAPALLGSTVVNRRRPEEVSPSQPQ